MDFVPFKKIPRLSRNAVITEKIDGTNAQIYIQQVPDGEGVDSDHILDYWYGGDGRMLAMYAGSRNRWLSSSADNMGFWNWAKANVQSLKGLGPGHHFGEWWGKGIQRGYGLKEKRFSLFNTFKWGESRPDCCHVVPVLWTGMFGCVEQCGIIEYLAAKGSVAAPGFMDPEGIVVLHEASGHMFKKTVRGDESPKGLVK